MDGIPTEEFVELKPKKILYSSKNSSEYKKSKCLHKNLVAKISQNEKKNGLSNKKCIRYSMNRIQRKNYRIYKMIIIYSTYKIKIHLPCFSDKIYILSNEIDMLALRT